MRCVFFGVPEFAVPSLRRLASSSAELAAVVAQPDRPRGRGRKLLPPPVKVAAESLGIPVLQPPRVRDAAFIETLRRLKPDIAAVVAYGQLLPKSILKIPRFGFINLHPSALPKYRGAAPIQRALWNGETETAATIMQLDEGEDTGPVLASRIVDIHPDETAPELSVRLADTGADLLASVVERYPDNPPAPLPQDDKLATKAPKLEREDGLIDWRQPASDIYNRFRACAGWPGAWTYLPDGQRLKISACRALTEPLDGTPGTVEAARGILRVHTGQGALELLTVRPPNRADMSCADYLNGLRGAVPSRFLSGEP